MINEYRSRRTYNLRCEYYKATRGPSSELTNSARPDGVFYARRESARYEANAQPLNSFQYGVSTLTLRTDDIAPLAPNDRVVIKGESWLVDNVQEKHDLKNEYHDDPEYRIIYLRRGS